MILEFEKFIVDTNLICVLSRRDDNQITFDPFFIYYYLSINGIEYNFGGNQSQRDYVYDVIAKTMKREKEGNIG
jgi:hypothetical protein